jgi:signal transduction histidine kinase
MNGVPTSTRSGNGETSGLARWLTLPGAGSVSSVLAVCVGYYVMAILSLIARFPSSGISTIWLATPVLLAALLIVPPRTWWVYCLALVPVHFHVVSTFQGPVPWPVMLVQLGGNCAHATLTAMALRRVIGAPPQLASLGNMFVFILLAGFASSWLVSAAVVYLFQLLGWTTDFWLPWRARSASNGAGTLILTPLILWVITGSIAAVRNAPLRRYGEFGVLMTALVGLGFVVFGDASAGSGSRPALLYAPLPLLLWAAVRFGTGGLCVALLVIAIQSLSNAIAGRGPFILQSPIENVLGLQLFLLAVATPLLLLSALLQQHHQTLSALRRSEIALRDGYEQVHYLTGRLITAQEAERKRIAGDLHDDLSQKLALLSLDMDRFLQPVTAEDDIAARVRRVSCRVREMAADVHSLSYQLHPAGLELIGLVAAMESMCGDVSAHYGLKVNFEHRHVPNGIDPDVALCLYRIVQEGLHNVVKHSGAREARVCLIGDGGFLDLRVTDRGVGFATGGTERAGIGLISTRERVSLVGGKIQIQSAPGAGTLIGVRVPVDVGRGKLSEVVTDEEDPATLGWRTTL